MRKLKILAVIAGILGVVLAIAYYFLIVERHEVAGCTFQVDIAELRRLAGSVPGEKPIAVHVEQIARFEMPGAVVIAGHPWAIEEMQVYSYQLVFPAMAPIIVDTALDEKQHEQMRGKGFDAPAFARMSRALATSSAIYVTHEHGDHFGGLIAQTATAAFARARITREQLAHPEILEPLVVPAEVKAMLEDHLFEYELMQPVAPGVVIFKAPGHTPGSQFIFAQMQDGTELLFLGDTAWKAASVKEATSPPRFVSLFLKNNRDAHTCQLVGLRALAAAEPNLIQIPGHDATIVQPLIARGVMHAQFK